MNYEEEAAFYYTLMEFAEIVKVHGSVAFSELEFVFPEIYNEFKAYLCNRELEESINEEEEWYAELNRGYNQDRI